MTGWWGRSGVERCSGSAKANGGRLIAAGAAVAAFAVVGTTPLTAAPAQADFDSLFDPIVSAFDSAAAAVVDPGLDVDSVLAALDLSSVPGLGDPFASLDALLGTWFQTLVYEPIQELGQLWINSPLGQWLDPLTAPDAAAATSWLFGDTATPLGGAVANPAADTATTVVPDTVSVPLRMEAITEPVVDISIGGGAAVPVLIDTGSAGLVIPWYDLGWQSLLNFPTGMGFGAYSGGLGYFYLTMPATIDFGQDTTTGIDIVTDPTSVHAVIFAWPTSLQSLFTTGGTWESYFAPAHVDGVLGIGPNAVGPAPDAIPTEALPGSWGQGVLIDQANGLLKFGPNPLVDGATTVAGAPNAVLAVSINGGPLQQVSSIIDSGGVYGTMPSKLLDSTGGTLPVGTQVSVYTANGQTLLYSYTINSGTPAPTIISSGAMNTGNYPFAQQPVYISNAGNGLTIFGGLTPDVQL